MRKINALSKIVLRKTATIFLGCVIAYSLVGCGKETLISYKKQMIS